MAESNVKQTENNNLVCKSLNNLEEINIVTLIDVLLDILSNCVRDQIDNQNKIISETYLDAYFQKDNEFSKELKQKPICGEDKKPKTPATPATPPPSPLAPLAPRCAGGSPSASLRYGAVT